MCRPAAMRLSERPARGGSRRSRPSTPALGACTSKLASQTAGVRVHGARRARGATAPDLAEEVALCRGHGLGRAQDARAAQTLDGEGRQGLPQTWRSATPRRSQAGRTPSPQDRRSGCGGAAALARGQATRRSQAGSGSVVVASLERPQHAGGRLAASAHPQDADAGSPWCKLA